MAQDIGPIRQSGIKPVEFPDRQTLPVASAQTGGQFQDILKAKLSTLKFSGHALERLQRRNIVLTQENLNKLGEAVKKAEEKGSRESLILMDDLALIVSIKNKTVITAVDGDSIKENVFTNIDSAVIMR